MGFSLKGKRKPSIERIKSARIGKPNITKRQAISHLKAEGRAVKAEFNQGGKLFDNFFGTAKKPQRKSRKNNNFDFDFSI